MRRVVITGLGAVSPIGRDAPSSFAAAVEGRSGVATITLFDASGYGCRIAGECTGFEAPRHGVRNEVRATDRLFQLAMTAADEALRDAGAERFDGLMQGRTGVILGVGTGGPAGSAHSAARRLIRASPKASWSNHNAASLCSLAPREIALKHGIRGTRYAIGSACASGAHAVGEAFRSIAAGDLDACLAGGAEAAVTALAVGALAASGVLTSRNAAPRKASRPWDQTRDGFVLAEGAGLLFMEEREQARRRGAHIWGELIGYGTSADSYHLAQSAHEGEGAQRAMQAALADAGVAPRYVDYINAHGSSTAVSDVVELDAIRSVFGGRASDGLWISSTKGATGNLLGAAGGLEAVFSLRALHDGVVPPTINLDRPAPEARGIDLVPNTARTRDLSCVLSNSFGLNGSNVSLVFQKHS